MPDLLERLTAALGDRYAIEREAGRGGMAVVFKAEDLRHHRQVAIKVLHPELTATLGAERFLHEIEIVAGLQHPHILPLYDSGEADGLLYYVMPYAEGESLRQRLNREKQLAVDESVRIAVEVADGLDYAHQKGVVHRDIKPGNILLSARHAVIADFGIARAIEVARADRVTSTGLGVGTPLYASPEQATAQETLDGRTDIYSLGCVLYEMLSGEPPLMGSTPQMIRARRMAETPTALHTLRNTVPPALDHVIARALARVPADRYATAAQFGQALQAVMFASTPASPASLAMTPGALAMTPSTLTTTPARVVPATRSKVLGGILVAVPILVMAVGAAWFLAERAGSDDETVPTGAVQLTSNGRVTKAIISPDGSQLAFAAKERGGGIRIAVSEIGTTEPPRTLAVVDALARSLRWSPDGLRVTFLGRYMGQLSTFSVSRSGGTVELARMPGDGLMPPGGGECLVWWSAEKFVKIDTLCGHRGEAPWPEGVDSIAVAGAYEFMLDAAYSPRGDYFLVSTYSGSGSGSIRAVSRSGDDQRLVVESGERLTSLHWRDNGRVLYYMRHLSAGLELMRLATKPNGESDSEPESILQLGDSLAVGGISSDGRRLVLVKTRTERGIVLLRPDGESLGREAVPGTAGAATFWVSPDGMWIAFLHVGSEGTDIYKVSIEGGVPRRLTSSGNIRDFSWSSDSRLLAYSAQWRDTMRVFLVSSDGGPAMPLRGSKTSGTVWWDSGPLMYQMPGNRNFMVTDSLHIRTFDGESLPLTRANLEASRGLVLGTSRPLVKNDSVGWMFSPRTSPDGESVVVYWNRARSGDAGLWRISISDSTQAPLVLYTRTKAYYPLIWTTDGTGFYASVGTVGSEQSKANEVQLMPSAGGEAETVLTLPDEPNYGCHPLETESESSWICYEIVSESDAWLIENFDSHVN